jgi:hypothetical protein
MELVLVLDVLAELLMQLPIQLLMRLPGREEGAEGEGAEEGWHCHQSRLPWQWSFQ